MMDRVMEFMNDTSLIGVENWRIALLLGGILGGLIIGRLARHILEIFAERFKRGEKQNVIGLILSCLAKPLAFFCFVIGLRLGFVALGVKPESNIAGMMESVLSVLYAIALGYAVYRLVDILDHYLVGWASGTESKIDDMLVPLVRKSLRVTVIVIIALFIIENFYGREKITTLIASLGVGGLAIALAAQDTVKNFFGSIMILLDKPFQVGERVVIGGHDGPVEAVGFRTTKVRTLDGHLVTVPNSMLVNDIIQNIGRRPFIKRIMNVTITYDTPPEKVRRAVEILKEILDNHEGMDPELPARVYFSDFNDCSLGILVIYWFHPPDYWAAMEFNEKVNMAILERFNEEGIEFAFPTQTVYLANDDKRQLALRMLNEGGSADA